MTEPMSNEKLEYCMKALGKTLERQEETGVINTMLAVVYELCRREINRQTVCRDLMRESMRESSMRSNLAGGIMSEALND